MSGSRIEGPLSALGSAIGDEFAKHHALPPDKKALARAEYGAGLLGVCGYLGLTVGPYLPGSWQLGILAAAAFGLMLLVAGVRGALVQRDGMTAFWCLALLIGGAWAVATWCPGLWGNFFGRGICIGTICATLARLFLALRGVGGDAERAVLDNMAAKNPPIIPVRRRAR